jgi:hypothetical protein
MIERGRRTHGPLWTGKANSFRSLTPVRLKRRNNKH